MASSTINDAVFPPSEVGKRLTGVLHGLMEGWRAYRRWQTLEAMSDQGLAHIGLDRRDTARAAMFGRPALGGR